MPRGFRVLVLLVAALVVGGAIFALFRDEGAPGAPGVTGASKATPTESPARSPEAGPADAVGRPQRSEAHESEASLPPREATGEAALVVVGLVTDARTGRPLEAAEVSVRYPDGESIEEAETDAEGSYRIEIESPAPARFYVTCWAEEHTHTSSPLLDAGGEGLVRQDFQLLPWFRIEGRVVSRRDGRPIEGADVEIRSRHPAFEEEWDDAETDESGYFVIEEIEDLPRTGIDLLVDSVDHAPAVMTDLSVPEGSDVLTVEFRLWPRLLVRGRVVDPHGKPVEDAEVSLLSHDPEYADDPEDDLTDEDGTFELEIDTMPYEGLYLLAAAEGASGVKVDPLPAPSAEGVVDVGDLRLGEPVVVRGSVVDARSGAPIPDADVTIYPAGVEEGEDGDFIDGEIADDTGRFEAEVVYTPRDAAMIYVEADGYFPKRMPLAIPPHVPEYEVTVPLEPVVRLEGTVVRRADGSPVAGARIRVLVPGHGIVTERCLADGRFTVELPRTESQELPVVVEFIDRRFPVGSVRVPSDGSTVVRRHYVVDLPPLRRKR